MKRKLATVGMCTIAMVCLMGAGAPMDSVDQETVDMQAAETLQQVPYVEDTLESAIPEEETVQVPETEEQPAEPEKAPIRFQAPESPDVAVQSVAAVSGTDPKPIVEEAEKALLAAHAVNLEKNMLIDGEMAPVDVGLEVRNKTPYVALGGFARAMDPSAESSWSGKKSTLTVTTSRMTVTARVGQTYVQANGRYLYLPSGVQLSNGAVSIPLTMAAKIFDASLNWDSASGVAYLTSGSGALKSGDAFYDSSSLFWLSRVIYLESGNQPLDGKMAVGNVVLNRVASSLFPNTLTGVLSQKNQFTTYGNGRMKKAVPNAESVVAAKLVLDGGVVAKTKGALWFDSAASSWASRHRTYVATIGGHRFFK